MSEIIAAIIGAVLTALITLVIYLYRNKITYAQEGISHEVSLASSILSAPRQGERSTTITSERLTIKNRGLRSLNAVELHWPASYEPVLMTINDTGSLSKAAVSVTWQNETARILIPTFPSGEEIKIDFLHAPYSARLFNELKGTGGKYKVVKLAAFRETRSVIFVGLLIFLAVIWTMFNIVNPMLTYLTSAPAQTGAASGSHAKP